MVVMVYSEKHVNLRIRAQTEQPIPNKEELMELVMAQGTAETLPGTSVTIRTLNAANRGILINNYSTEQTVEVQFKFLMVNYRIEEMPEGVDEVSKVMEPGAQELIIVSRVDPTKTCSVRTAMRYAERVRVSTEDQVIEFMRQ